MWGSPEAKLWEGIRFKKEVSLEVSTCGRKTRESKSEA